MVRAIFIAAAMVLALVHTAAANDREICKSGSRDNSTIAACTRVISSGAVKGADLAQVYYERGLKYRYNGNHDPAISDFTKAVALDPQWAWPYVARGHSYAAKKDFKNAFADQEKAIKIEPSHVTYVGRAIDLIEAGAFDLAMKDIDEALRLNPKYFYAYLNRGEIYLKKREFDKAAGEFRMALEIKPGDENATIGLKRAQNRTAR